MGIGDEVLGTGFARGAAARGKRIAFGDGRKLIWGPWCAEAFKNNPNIATRADDPNAEWLAYYKGHRGYNRLDQAKRRWIWNYDFKAPRGEFFFGPDELMGAVPRPGTALLEPNVPWHKSVAINKDWGEDRYQNVADRLRRAGWRIIQTSYGKVRLHDVETIYVRSYRDAAAVLAGIDVVICPEGGLHHAAAAVGARAIVIHGGFTPPAVLGYDGHHNLTGGAEACGSLDKCDHCRQALNRIEVDHVYALAATELCEKNSTASPGVA